MESPLISVVFTSYNHKEYLCQALDSLLAQTFTDFELIIIDDCSTDGSQEILSEYAKRDSRIRLTLNSKNSGSYVYSTNQGAALATAPYLVFAQCDDWAENDQLEKLYFAIEHTNSGVVFSKSNLVDERGKFIGTDFDTRDSRFKSRYGNGGLISSYDAFKELMQGCIIPNLSAAMIKRSLFNELNGLSSEYKVLADWDFWIRLSTVETFYYVPDPLNNFRQHSTTIRSQVHIAKQMDELVNMYQKAISYHPEIKNYILNNAALNWVFYAHGNIRSWLKSFIACWKKGKKLTAWWWYYSFRGIIVAFCKYVIHCLKLDR